MVTLEIDGIKVEAETVRKAQSMVRKEQAARERERQALESKRLPATERARHNGYLVMMLDADGHLRAVNNYYAIVQGDAGNETWREQFREHVKPSPEGSVFTWGKAAHTFSGLRLAAYLEACDGEVLAVKTVSRDGNAAHNHWSAIGIVGDVMGFVRLPESVETALDVMMGLQS